MKLPVALLEKDGTMTRRLVTVMAPLALTPASTGKPVLMLGEYVRVELDGLDLGSVATVDRSLFRDGDSRWIMNAEYRPLTTFGGRIPMILETSHQARFTISMPLSHGYGILFATAISLILVPGLYLIVEDVKRLDQSRQTAI